MSGWGDSNERNSFKDETVELKEEIIVLSQSQLNKILEESNLKTKRNGKL